MSGGTEAEIADPYINAKARAVRTFGCAATCGLRRVYRSLYRLMQQGARARCRALNHWCGWRGSNPRPLASEANTLSTELQPHVRRDRKTAIIAHSARRPRTRPLQHPLSGVLHTSFVYSLTL